MSDKIITRPVTDEYAEGWERIFGRPTAYVEAAIEAPGRPVHGLRVTVTEAEFYAGETRDGWKLSSLRYA